MIRYSIIIVNYKTPQLLLDCLQTIYAADTDGCEVIIVDNDSQDNSRETVTSEYPMVNWIQMSYNSGFARANNAGIRQAKGEVVLLLNSDTLNEDNAIATCYRRLISSSYPAAGVQLLNRDRSPQISGNFFMKGGLNHLMALPYLGRFIRWVGLRMKVKKTNVAEATGVVEVDWINGAFIMAKRSAIDTAGLLDEDFFLYSEEIEWCSRLRKQGPLCVYGDLHVVHLEGASANTAFASKAKGYANLSDRKGFQLMISGLLRIRKQFGVIWWLIHICTYFTAIPVAFTGAMLKTLMLSNVGEEWKNWWGFTKNTFKLMPFLPRMAGDKRYFYKVL
ncbi:MAG: glycosyltransferase family 2 protein [Citrobacter freundii]|nr:MAG: glycosyltransferase family 2 protein [Citrobacter freundii]